jgi:hypothetical protein
VNSGTSSIGRANLDGSGVNTNFITGANPFEGLTADGTHLYWSNFAPATEIQTIGRANLDGTEVNQNFIMGL